MTWGKIQHSSLHLRSSSSSGSAGRSKVLAPTTCTSQLSQRLTVSESIKCSHLKNIHSQESLIQQSFFTNNYTRLSPSCKKLIGSSHADQQQEWNLRCDNMSREYFHNTINNVHDHKHATKQIWQILPTSLLIHCALIWTIINQNDHDTIITHADSHHPNYSTTTTTTTTTGTTSPPTILSTSAVNNHNQKNRNKYNQSIQQKNKRRKGPPPQFGYNIPHHLLQGHPMKHSSLNLHRQHSTDATSSNTNKNGYIDNGNGIDLENREDCPMCRKYSKGPCGKLFQQWLHQCVDHKEQTGTTDDQCDNFVEKLDACWNQHEEFYEKMDLYTGDDEAGSNSKSANVNSTMKERFLAWSEFIKDLEQPSSSNDSSLSCSGSFPIKISPELHIRKSGEGMIEYASHYQPDETSTSQSKIISSTTMTTHKVLLMAYVKDQNGQLLGAGSVEDLFHYDVTSSKQTSKEDSTDVDDTSCEGRYLLRFAITPDSKDVTAYALYADDTMGDEDKDEEIGGNDDLVLFHLTQRVPSF